MIGKLIFFWIVWMFIIEFVWIFLVFFCLVVKVILDMIKELCNGLFVNVW